jgi:solute:Na+ symporter, SSS family
MSISAANLFTRNVYRQYFKPNCTEREESYVARATSLLVKVGALAFILFLPNTFAIDFQLLGGVWILQTLPAVFLGLYTSWFHRQALIIGWAVGMSIGTWMAVVQNFQSSVYPLAFGGITISVYAALAALVVNVFLVITLTPLLHIFGVARGQDATTPADFEAHPVPVSQEVLLNSQISHYSTGTSPAAQRREMDRVP